MRRRKGRLAPAAVLRRLLVWAPVIVLVMIAGGALGFYFVTGWRARDLAAKAVAQAEAGEARFARLQMYSARSLRANDPAVKRAAAMVESRLGNPEAVRWWEEVPEDAELSGEEIEVRAEVMSRQGSEEQFAVAVSALDERGEAGRAAELRAMRSLRSGNFKAAIELLRGVAADDHERRLRLLQLLVARYEPVLGKRPPASPEEAAFLVKELNRNRIQFNEAQQRILELAKKDPKVLPELAAQLAGAEEIPAEAVPLLVGLVRNGGIPAPSQTGARNGPITLSQAITALSKTDSADGVSATLAALEPLKKLPDSGKDYDAALAAFLNAPKLENHHQLIEQIAEKAEWPVSMYAYAALLNLANRKTGSPESIQLSQKALDIGWADAKHRKLIIDAISASKHMPSAAKVLAGLDDPDAEVKGAAERAAKVMRLQKIEDTSPKLASLKPEQVLGAVLKEKGDVSLGEQIFAKATCVACHTVKETEAQKGPYLGNIAQTYKRADLAENIWDPNKTIAQGFASEAVTLKDGTQQMGFITLEGAEEIKLRNIAAQEFTFKVSEIQVRQKLPISMMPPGLMMNFTVKEFASLLDYLESLAKK
jgi:putative heme-binding domain-containing protein